MKRKSSYLFIALVFSLGILLRYCMKVTSELKNCKADTENITNIIYELSNYSMIQNHYNGKSLEAYYELYDFLKASLEDGPKLIVSFNEYSCEACIDYLIDWIDMVSKEIDKSKIVFLVMYEDEHEASFINRRLHEEYAFFSYSSGKELFVDEDYKYVPPCVYILTSDLVITNFFIFSIKFQELNEEYLRDVKTNFKLGY